MFNIFIDHFNKNRVKFLQYKAFTLAEVLITLGIIGIIAALTIPTLVQKTQNQEYVTGLKKAYSETNQALKLMSNDYGCPGDLKCTGLFDTDTTNQSFGDILVKYFHVVKNCGIAANQGCWASVLNTNYDSTGTKFTYDAYDSYKFITADGMSFYVENYKNDCDTDSYSNHKTNDMTQTCGTLIIDVNGLKKPNVEGRDIFRFFITNGKGPLIYPRGGIDDNYGGENGWWTNESGAMQYCYSGNTLGDYCAGRIIEQGWQMEY